MAKGRARRRRIAVVTGTRAEYGLLRSTMEAISRHRSLQLQVVVTGMHLLRRFGHTVDDILDDGWGVDARVPMQCGDDSSLDQAAGLARGVDGIARFCEAAKTDIVLVLGDRIEAMAGALAAVTTGRLLAHIHGGDLAPGDFDDSLRHAITKLAHLHLAATRSAQRRIIRMGETAERVHWVGAPGLDHLAKLVSAAKRNGRDRAGTPKALILHHACGRTPAYERRVMSAVLRVVDEGGFDSTCIYPNSDRGHSGTIEAIAVHRRRGGPTGFEVVRSLDRDTYLRRLIDADLLVGNSSSGIIEAATAGTAVVNIGPRQLGRERSGNAVVDADETLDSIREAVEKARRKRPIMGSPTVYGDGTAGKRIADLLAKTSLSDGFRKKVNAY